MRGIKFRAKMLGTGELIYFDLSGLHTRDGITYARAIGIDLDTLQEYTGLKDKSGKEIYDGDIVCYGMWSDGKGKCLYKVFWNDEGARFDTLDLRHNQEMTHVDTFEAEVIGNIYENEDLLK